MHGEALLVLTNMSTLIPKDENVLSITGSFRLEKTLKIIEAAINTTRPSVHIHCVIRAHNSASASYTSWFLGSYTSWFLALSWIEKNIIPLSHGIAETNTVTRIDVQHVKSNQPSI